MADRFDTLLIDVCSVYKRGAGAVDDYATASQDLELVEADIACRKSTISKGDEKKVDKQFTVDTEKIFMRATALGSGGVALSEHHVIEFDDEFYNILSVLDPSNLHHHLEVFVERIKP